MDASVWVALIGTGLTFIVSTINLVTTWRRNKRTDYISKVTEYRLKWIDLARIPIAEYLLSIDKLKLGNDEHIEEDYSFFLEKHWKMQSFLTTFSPADQNAQKQLDTYYQLAANLIASSAANRSAIRSQIGNGLPDTNKVLRKLMDDNWFDVKKEIATGKK